MQGSTRIDELRQKFHENPRRYFAPLANEYRKAGDPEQAIAICRAHLAQQPGHMSGHVVYGQALFDANRREEARAVFEKALALDPDNAIVLKHLGDIAREKGDTSEAKHWYSRAIDLDPSDREVAAYIAELAEPVTEREASVTVEREPEIETVPETEIETVPGTEIETVPETEIETFPEPEPALEIETLPEPGPIAAEVPGEIAQIAPVEADLEPAPAEGDVAWRKTPPHEESPFVTRTMAELYASQGYREAALDVYRQLALHHPDDKEIFDRIEALQKDESARTQEPAMPQEPERVQEPAAAREPEKVQEPERPLDAIPFEPLISDLPVEPDEMEIDEAAAFPPAAEDLNLESPATAPHFTELELGASGDSWDKDSWAAGFHADEDANLDFDSPDVPATAAETQPAAPPSEPERASEAFASETIAEPVPESEPEPEPDVAAPEAIPVISEPVVDIVTLPGEVAPEPAAELPPEPAPEEEAEPEEAGEYEPEPEEASFVAYSPQLPEKEDLPHYAPKHPTVREFFATIGAFRPPAKAGSSITAHAAMPETGHAPMAESPLPRQADDYPLATDAFASLFGDAPVNEDDTRAAFALSGAIGASTPPSNVAVSAPIEPQPAPEPAPGEQPAQESEEDIRRFREWLDGLAES